MYSESESKPGLEYWDLMDGGEYNHNGTDTLLHHTHPGKKKLWDGKISLTSRTTPQS